MQTPEFSQMSRREIEDYLVERALVDGTFRDGLLKNPETTLRDLGIPVGPQVKIRVIEEEPDSFYLILPRQLPETDELNEADLENVSGGGTASPGALFFGYTSSP